MLQKVLLCLLFAHVYCGLCTPVYENLGEWGALSPDNHKPGSSTL